MTVVVVVAVNEPRESVPLSVVVAPPESLMVVLSEPVNRLPMSVTVLLSLPVVVPLSVSPSSVVSSPMVRAAVIDDSGRFAAGVEVFVQRRGRAIAAAVGAAVVCALIGRVVAAAERGEITDRRRQDARERVLVDASWCCCRCCWLCCCR